MEKQGLIKMEDAEVIVRDAEGKIQHKGQVDRGVKIGAVGGGMLGLLLGMGLLLGVGSGPTLERYSHLQGGSTLIAQAAGATALFIGGFGAYGYATRRDLSHWARTLFFALLGLIGFGLVAIFVRIPHAQQIYAVVGLGIFSAYTMFDFNRLRRASDADSVFIAASIFLDILNVFFLMLSLMGGGRRS